VNHDTLRAFRIGFQPQEGRRDPAEHWGFPARADGRPGWVHILRGIVIPWLLDGQLWQLKIRTNRQQPKYLAISGGHPCLFGADTLVVGEPAILPKASSTPCCCGRRSATSSALPRWAVATEA
jgi:hypothetical protein